MRNYSEKIMSFDPGSTPEWFVRHFFDSSGAAIETHSDGLSVLLPGNLARRLDVPEFLKISTGKNTEEKYSVRYGSPFLEKILDVACSDVPLIRCRLNFNYIKSQGFDKLIKDQFVFHNAVGRVQSTAEVRTEYLLLTCRYLAQSDEQKEGIVALAFNLETGASVSGIDTSFNIMDKTFETGSEQIPLENLKINKVLAWVRHQAGQVLTEEIQSFQDSMNRRFKRDVANLDEYYKDLRKEMEENLKRTGISDQLVSDRKTKISLIPDELKRKKEDLFKKYSIRVMLGLCGGIHIRTPAVKVLYKVSFRKTQKQLSMIYNPVNKMMDPLVCEGCGNSTFNIGFCDSLHILCPACRRNCPVC